MKCIADFSLTPIGKNVSVSDEIIQCERILRSYNIETQLHAFGTNLYGDWDEVFAAVKACHTELHDKGTVRLASTLRIGTRTDKDQSLDDRIKAVNEGLK